MTETELSKNPHTTDNNNLNNNILDSKIDNGISGWKKNIFSFFSNGSKLILGITALGAALKFNTYYNDHAKIDAATWQIEEGYKLTDILINQNNFDKRKIPYPILNIKPEDLLPESSMSMIDREERHNIELLKVRLASQILLESKLDKSNTYNVLAGKDLEKDQERLAFLNKDIVDAEKLSEKIQTENNTWIFSALSFLLRIS